jgi:hypothetical protein
MRVRRQWIPAAVVALLLGWTSCALAADVVDTSKPDAGAAADAIKPNFIEKTTESGPVKARVRLEPVAPVIGDTVTLTVEVTAADGIALEMPEFGQSLDRFSVREFVPKQTVDASGNQVSTQRYVLEPPLSGPQSIPPLLIEFVDHRPGQRAAPDGEQSYELITERIPFEVSSVVPAGAGADLKPARGHLSALRGPQDLWPWLLALVVLAAIAAPLLWRRFAAARARVRRRSAWEIARSRLDTLASRQRPTEAEEIDTFFVELSALIRRYLEDRFELRAPELTTEEFLQVASASPDLGQAHQGFLLDFLRRADMVKFARFIPSTDEIESALAAASSFLDETHQADEQDQNPPVAAAGVANAWR